MESLYNDTKVRKTTLTASDAGYWANGKCHRDFEGRIVFEEIPSGILMVKNKGWCGVGRIERHEGKETVYVNGGIKMYGEGYNIIPYKETLL